jgi:hypothetical protein
MSISPHLSVRALATVHLPGDKLNSVAECDDRARIDSRYVLVVWGPWVGGSIDAPSSPPSSYPSASGCPRGSTGSRARDQEAGRAPRRSTLKEAKENS